MSSDDSDALWFALSQQRGRLKTPAQQDGPDGEPRSDGREELYALDADPGETRDLSAAEPERTAELRARLAGWRASFTPAATNGAAPELDAEIRRRLHDLGYIED